MNTQFTVSRHFIYPHNIHTTLYIYFCDNFLSYDTFDDCTLLYFTFNGGSQYQIHFIIHYFNALYTQFTTTHTVF